MILTPATMQGTVAGFPLLGLAFFLEVCFSAIRGCYFSKLSSWPQTKITTIVTPTRIMPILSHLGEYGAIEGYSVDPAHQSDGQVVCWARVGLRCGGLKYAERSVR